VTRSDLRAPAPPIERLEFLLERQTDLRRIPSPSHARRDHLHPTAHAWAVGTPGLPPRDLDAETLETERARTLDVWIVVLVSKPVPRFPGAACRAERCLRGCLAFGHAPSRGTGFLIKDKLCCHQNLRRL
jgi:hypothetical protein